MTDMLQFWIGLIGFIVCLGIKVYIHYIGAYKSVDQGTAAADQRGF